MLYLDHASTTPVDPSVIQAMVDELQHYGNPSSKYYPEAVAAQQRLRQYRQTVADTFNTYANNIIFNSGATEGNNHVILGNFYANPNKKHFITTNAEHKSVLEAMKFIETLGAEVTYLPVSDKCTVTPEQVANAIKEDTNLVSIFFANNEVGSINPIKSIGDVCREHNVLFHTDATQAVGKISINLSSLPIDFLTFSGHKIFGPKGVGALYIGNNDYGIRHKLTPLLHGGDQEFKARPGTQSMHNIAGLAKACELVPSHIEAYNTQVLETEKAFISELINTFDDKVILFGDQENKIPGLISFALEGLNNEMFLANYSNEVSLSTGSACAIDEPSHVLKAMGYSRYINKVLRISLPISSYSFSPLIFFLTQYISIYSL